MNFRSIIISTLLVGLVIISLIYFSVNFSTENSTNLTLTDNPTINKVFANLTEKLNESSTTAEAQRTGFTSESSNPVVTALGFVFRSIVNAGVTFITMTVNIFSLIFYLPSELLGVSPIVIGVFTAILLIVLIFSIWRTIRSGE